MNSDKGTAGASGSGGKDIPATPAIALLSRRLGTSPTPRMLTPYEIDLLRQCAKEIAAVTEEVLARSDDTSKT